MVGDSKKLRRPRALAAWGILAAMIEVTAPVHALEVIVPWPVGGETDLLVRPIGPYLSKHLNRPVTFSNIAGNFGVSGVADLAKRASDGNSVVVVHDYLYSVKRSGKDSIDPAAELRPVCGLISHPSLLASSKLKLKNQDIRALLAKGRPLDVSWTAGPTSTNFTMLALIAQVTGADLRFKGYRSKAAAISALNDGEVELAEIGPEVLADTSSANVVPLAISSEARDARLPSVPTLKELGINVTYAVLRGLAVPRDTPAGVRADLEKACLAAGREKSLDDDLAKLGARAVSLSGDQFVRLFEQSRRLYASGIGPKN